MSFAVVWLILGLGLGVGIALAIRKPLVAWRKRRHAELPSGYASRQALRKATRERKKKAR